MHVYKIILIILNITIDPINEFGDRISSNIYNKPHSIYRLINTARVSLADNLVNQMTSSLTRYV